MYFIIFYSFFQFSFSVIGFYHTFGCEIANFFDFQCENSILENMNIQEQNPQSPTASSTAPLQRSSPKIAILHDAFLYRGGGERLVTLMAKSLDADLISGFFSEGSFDPRELGFEGRMIPLGKPVFAKGIRHTILKYRFQHKTQFLSEYDIVIFSGNCLDAVK